MSEETLLSVEEIAKHSSNEDCWIVVEGKVWDLTEFAPSHPGGAHIINKHAGRDATTTYNTIHAPSLLANNLDPSKYKGRVDKTTITEEWSRPPPEATPELRLNEKPPLNTIISADDFEKIAERTIPKKTWAFYSSAATDCITRDENKSFFQRIRFRPRLLRNVRKMNSKTQILGQDVGLPFFVSPAAMAKMVNPEGEKGIAAGCGPNNVAQCVSTNASFPLEEIIPAAPNGHPFFFQLYVNKDRSKTVHLLKKVEALGVKSIFVTIDGPVPGKREADERVKADETDFTPMSGAKAKNDKKGGGLGRIMGNYIADDFDWSSLKWLRGIWKGGIVVKGVQCAEDARMCAEMGVQGVLLSNHGGRNLDSSPPAIMTLIECQRICPEIFDKLEVFVDGGVRRGADVVKCLCLGATAVGMGRPFLYALNYGQEGVEHLIEIIKDEVETTMRLIGATDLADLHPGLVSTLDVDHLIETSTGHPYATGRSPRARQGLVRSKL